MSVIIADELQTLFDLRDHQAAAMERLMMAEAELQGNLQLLANKPYVDLHDLELTHKLMAPAEAAKKELEVFNAKLDEKKQFFIRLLEAAGHRSMRCTNKEFNATGHFEYVPYILSIGRNLDGVVDLIVEREKMAEPAPVA